MALAIRTKSLSVSVMRSRKQQPGRAPVKTACRTRSSVARFSGLAQTVASRRAPCRHLRLMTTAVRPADGVCDTLLAACSRDQAQGGVPWSTPAQHHRAQDLTPITRSRICHVAPVIHRDRIKNPRSAAMRLRAEPRRRRLEPASTDRSRAWSARHARSVCRAHRRPVAVSVVHYGDLCSGSLQSTAAYWLRPPKLARSSP